MSAKIITLENAKGYASEKNLMAALEKTGLADWGPKIIVARKPDGKWTAIFLVAEFASKEGGYMGFAAQKGFMSV